jgi:hypothetical protein
MNKNKRYNNSKQKRTSIGKHIRKTKPRNKNKRRNWKNYRGQGK